MDTYSNFFSSFLLNIYSNILRIIFLMKSRIRVEKIVFGTEYDIYMTMIKLYIIRLLRYIIYLLDSNIGLASIVISDSNYQREIIVNNKSISEICNMSEQHIFNPNDVIIKLGLGKILSKTTLVCFDMDEFGIESITNTYDLGNIFMKYCDQKKDYDCTMKNILHVNNMDYSTSDIIQIKYYDGIESKTKELKLMDFYDKHYMTIYDEI